MKRWEFDSINQAAMSISSWFSGTLNEKLTLMEYLDAAEGEYLLFLFILVRKVAISNVSLSHYVGFMC